MSGVACFMPSAEKRQNSADSSARGNYFFNHLNRHFHPRTLPSTEHVFDDALTVFILTTIASSERSLEPSLQYWLAFLNFIVQKLDLQMDDPSMSEEDKEERRR